jgi:hypothetical protein
VRALVDHGAACATCAEAWRVLAEVRREAPTAPAQAPALPPLAARRRPWMRSLWPFALSAAAAVAAFSLLRPPPAQLPPVERGTTVPAMRAESPAVQAAPDVVLRWSSVPGASTYNVTVLTPELVVVHRALGLSSAELRLPEAVARKAAGSQLLWNVDAVLENGRSVASPTFELQLR